MHWQRVLSALLIVPPFLLLVVYGSPLHFSLVLSVICALVAWEFSRLCPAGTSTGLSVVAVVGAVAWHAALVLNTGVAAVGGLIVGAGLGRAALGRQDFREATLQSGWAAMGAAYAGVLLGSASLLRALAAGRQLVIFVTVLTWAADSAAFYVGRRFGRTRLAPRVSPGKTVEGAVGGIAAAALAGVLGSGWAWEMSWGRAMAASVLVSVVGLVGDLAESAVKRAAGVKDSGGLIPGHGGILDRLDSLVFATPVVYGVAWLGWL